MSDITIDGVEYDSESLSDEAKAQIASLQAAEQKIAQTQQDLAILQTARNAYAAALKDILSSD
mgnify:FL=1